MMGVKEIWAYESVLIFPIDVYSQRIELKT